MRKQKTTKKILAAFLLAALFGSDAALSVSAYEADQTSFVGLRKSTTARILDDFKEKQNEIYFENAPFTVEEEFGIFDADRKMNGLEQILKRLENTRTQFQDRKMAITQEKVTLRNTLKAIDASIEDTKDSIRKTELDIVRNTREISEYEAKISELQAKISENRKSILEYLAYVYSKGDLMYSEEQDIDIVKSIILNDGNLSDILMDIHYKSLLQTAGQNFVEIHRSLVRQYYLESENLKKRKIQSLRLKADLRARRSEFESQREYKERLLRITQGQEALFNRFILQKAEREKELMKSISKIQAEYDSVYEDVSVRTGCQFERPERPESEESASGSVTATGGSSTGSVSQSEVETDGGAVSGTGSESGTGETEEEKAVIGPDGFAKLISGPVEKCTELAKFYIAEKELRDSRAPSMTGSNLFTWPVTPKYVSSYYRDQEYYESVGSDHEAIDIAVDQWTDISAPADGYVYYVNPPVDWGYGYVALKHSDGMMTVYGHVSEVFYERFQFVAAGTVFAKSGGAPGTPGAGVMTTGPHLHFETYKNRESVDPLRFLDLTYLRYESLDVKYRYKFVQDLKARYGRRANLDGKDSFAIAGEDEIERQRNLLGKYAAPDFKDWNVWTEEAVSAKIDPSFLMCIGLAETGIWKNLKTAYNVGNVGNTDSGGTYDFADAREGIYWMGKTLNNQFLGKYDRVSDLSRWGNKSGSIYASSSKHWHTNVIRCLSALKGRFVEDDFRFRIESESDLADPDAEMSKLLKKRAKNVVVKKR